DPCLAPVCHNDPNFRGCGFEPVAGCCHDDADCNDHDLCTRDVCDQSTHRCTNDLLACWVLDGTGTTTVAAQGRSQSRRTKFRGLLLIDEMQQYRLPGFAGCDAATAVDEIGALVPSRGGRIRLVSHNLEDERTAFFHCSLPLRLRRRTGWLRVADDE